MTKELERLRDELAQEASGEDHTMRDGEGKRMFRAGWDRLLKYLTEAAGEFDEIAAKTAAREEPNPEWPDFVEGARWLFEQNRARIGLIREHYRSSEAEKFKSYEVRNEMDLRIKQLESHLAESERLKRKAWDLQCRLEDKLTAAEAEILAQKFKHAEVSNNLSDSRERVRELESFHLPYQVQKERDELLLVNARLREQLRKARKL